MPRKKVKKRNVTKTHTLIVGAQAMIALKKLVALEKLDHAKTLKAQTEIAIFRCLNAAELA